MAAPPRISHLSGSTAFTSTTSLASVASSASTVVPPSNGQVVATNNIINQRADASRSLYQICVSLKQRLAQVPGFEQYLAKMDALEAQNPDGGIVDSVWSLLKLGSPLLFIYNLLQPENPIVIDDAGASDKKKSQMYIYKFVEAVKKDLNVVDIFTISDLIKDDTTGFVKVCLVSPPFVDPLRGSLPVLLPSCLRSPYHSFVPRQLSWPPPPVLLPRGTQSC